MLFRGASRNSLFSVMFLLSVLGQAVAQDVDLTSGGAVAPRDKPTAGTETGTGSGEVDKAGVAAGPGAADAANGTVSTSDGAPDGADGSAPDAAQPPAESASIPPAPPAPNADGQTIDEVSVDAGALPRIDEPSGIFNYTYPFHIPTFRGLEPKLGVSYSSAGLRRGRPDAIVGDGWKVSGLSVIERRSVGNGIATFAGSAGARDILTLDGQTLLSCWNASASPPAPSVPFYATDHVDSANASASCRSSGDLTPQREDYRRIIRAFDTSANVADGTSIYQFFVSEPDGKTYVFKSLGALASSNMAGFPMAGTDPRFNAVFNRRYLLAEIADTQTNTNLVKITYDFSSIADGLAERPRLITYGDTAHGDGDYGGYKIKFGYSSYDAGQTTVPVVRFGVGTDGMFGRQAWLLRSVQVFDHPAQDREVPIRAYALTYLKGSSNLVELNQNLVSLREIAGDFVISPTGDGSVAVGPSGLQMPATSFAYSGESPSYTTTAGTPTGMSFGDQPIFADVDPDGRSEIIFPRIPGSQHQLGEVSYRLNTTDMTSLATFPLTIIGDWGHTNRYPVTIIPKKRNSAQEVRSYIGYRKPSGLFDHNLEVILQGNSGGGIASYTSPSSSAVYAGELDGDRGAEGFIVGVNESRTTTAFNLDGDSLSAFTWPEEIDPFRCGRFGDFDGNGLTDWFHGVDGNGPNCKIGSIVVHSTMYQSDRRRTMASTLSGDLIASDPSKTMPVSADVNGDGLDDLVVVEFLTGNTIRVHVGLSNGFAFPASEIWFDGSTGGTNIGAYYRKVVPADLNGDGLLDLIVGTGGASVSSRPSSGVAFLNTGKSFVRQSNLDVANFIGAADINGDGLPDLVGGGAGSGVIRYSAGLPANYLTVLTTPLGAIYTVAYAPTSDGTGIDPVVTKDDIPGPARQVVASLKVDDGRGHANTTYYRYDSEVWDDGLRQSRGFTTVRDYLPNLSGEAARSIRTKVFDTSSSAKAGTLVSDTLWAGTTAHPYDPLRDPVQAAPGFNDQILSRKLIVWNSTGSGTGPFVQLKADERVAQMWGTGLVETKTHSWYNYFSTTNPYPGGSDYSYGRPTQVVDYGFTSSLDGTDLDTTDNLLAEITYALPKTTRITVAAPRGAYVAILPASKKLRVGAIVSSEENYLYDGSATLGAAALIGNQTKYLVRTNVPYNRNNDPGAIFRTVSTKTYDGWGNVLTDKNARNKTTTYTYDTTKHLFRASSTNALPVAQTVSTDWNAGCQAPAKQTDANGLATDFTYDTLCREANRSFPIDQTRTNYVATQYIGIGNPKAQFVIQTTLSPQGTAVRQSRKYLDGLGRGYMSMGSGGAVPLSDPNQAQELVSTITEYDPRGNADWQSNPLDWVTASAYLADIQAGNAPALPRRTRMVYDRLDRQVELRFPDYNASGSAPYNYETTAYSTEMVTYGTVNIASPKATHRDALCFDTAAATICGKTATLSDGHGRTIQTIQYKNTDASAAQIDDPTSPIRTTFNHDALGRLTGVTDPIGATWAYTYDAFGNRLTSNDPGLGTWSMTYDDTNNLLVQTDAKGQTITFAYDAIDRVLNKVVAAGGATVKTIYAYDEPRNDPDGKAYPNAGQLTGQRVSLPSTTGTYSWLDIVASDYTATGQIAAQSRTIDKAVLKFTYTYAADGVTLTSGTLPVKPGEGAVERTAATMGTISYDRVGRVTGYVRGTTRMIASVTYDLWGQPDITTYGSGAYEDEDTNINRGWVTQIRSYENGASGAFLRNSYSRLNTGRIATQTLEAYYLGGAGPNPASFDYTYDYAGRLLAAKPTTPRGDIDLTQSLTYDLGGRITSNTANPGGYNYDPANYGPGTASKPIHAPAQVGGGSTLVRFTYDANGNMTSGLGGKVMTYDGENRPLSVLNGTVLTCYAHGADGARLKKITVSGATGATPCPAQNITGAGVTLYAGNEEFRNWLVVGTTDPEAILISPLPNIRLAFTTTNSAALTDWTAVHRDAQASVRGVTNAAGLKVERTIYRPYGNWDASLAWATPTSPPPAESRSWISERLDAEAGLQFLNARYFDPKLGLFTQPDWLDVTKPGVGTNRYSYAGGDPVNGEDRGGSQAEPATAWAEFTSWLEAVSTSVAGAAANINAAPVAEAASALPRIFPISAGVIWGLSIGPAGGPSDDVQRGAVLTPEMTERGWYVDGSGKIRDADGVEVFAGADLADRMSAAEQINRQFLAKQLLVDGALKTTLTVKDQLSSDRSYIPTQSILDTIQTGKRTTDPQGVPGFFMYTSDAHRQFGNGQQMTVSKSGRLEVLVDETNFIIAHVMFKTK